MIDRTKKIVDDGNNRAGYRLLNSLLHRDHGIVVNRKRFFRIYSSAGMQVPKRRKRHARYVRNGSSSPTRRVNERWSVDFVHDTLANGRKTRFLTVVDEFTNECLAIEVDSTLPSRRVIAVLERIIVERGTPVVLENRQRPKNSRA